MKKFFILVSFLLVHLAVACMPKQDLNQPTATSEPKDIVTIATTKEILVTEEVSPPTITPTNLKSSQPTRPPTDTATPISQPEIVAFLGSENSPSGLTPSNFDLYLLHKDGTILRITENANIRNFSWSPDGKNIVFSGVIDFSSYDLYLLHVDSTTINKLEINLEFDAAEVEPAWSPDGKKIAFAQFFAGTSTIYTYDLLDATINLITEGASPTWHPSGNIITFVHRESTSIFGRMSQIDLRDGQVIQLLEGVFVDQPNWSPSGERLAFIGHSSDFDAGIYTTMLGSENVTFVSKSILPPAWNSTNDEILFAKPVTNMPHTSRIYVFNAIQNSIELLDWAPNSFFIYLAHPQPSLKNKD